MSARAWWIVGCAVGFLAVALGAMGAHGMEKVATPEALARWWEPGVRYAALHAFALLAVAWVASRSPSRAAQVAGWSFVAGVVLFSGSLWVMTPTGLRKLGMITPFGGMAFLAGWIALAIAGARALAAPPTPPTSAAPTTDAARDRGDVEARPRAAEAQPAVPSWPRASS